MIIHGQCKTQTVTGYNLKTNTSNCLTQSKMQIGLCVCMCVMLDLSSNGWSERRGQGQAVLFCIRYCGVGESFAYVTGPTGNTLFTLYHNKQQPRNITQDYDAHPKTNKRI